MSDRLEDLVRKVSNNGMSRREFVKRAAALGLSMGAIGSILAACGGGTATPAATETATAAATETATATAAATETATAAATETATAAATETATASATTAATDFGGQTLTVQVWAGSYEEQYRKNVFTQFEQKYDCKIQSVASSEYYTLSKIKQEADSGDPKLDVSVELPGDVSRGGKDGIFETLTEADIPNIKNLYTPSSELMPYGVGYLVYSYGIGYRTDIVDKFGKQPKAWADLWDPVYAKTITIGTTTPTYTIESLNIMLTGKATPIDDLDAIFKKLDELKPNIHSFTDTPAQAEQLLVNKEVYLYMIFEGRIWEMADRGIPVDYQIPTEGLFGANDYFAITKGTKRRDMAVAFINFALQPEQQTAIAKGLHYGPTNKNTVLPPDVAKRAIYGEDQWALLKFADPEYEAANVDAWTERWNQWQASFS